MSPDIIEEVYFFITSLLMGIMITFAYDFLIIFRKVIRHNNFFVSLEDILFWIACAISIFSMLYKENNGVPRWFSIAGAVIGMGLYKITVSRLFVRLMTTVFTGILHLFYKALYIMGKPFRLLFGKVRKISKKTGRSFHKTGRICKKKLTACRKMIKMILCKR